MTPKQSILFASTLLLLACSTEELTDDTRNNAIRFAATQVITRAETETLDKHYHIYVSALWHTSDTRQFADTRIKELTQPTDQVPSWGTGWFWPPAGEMSFIAWGGNNAIDSTSVRFTYTGGDTLPSASPATTFDTLHIDLTGKMDGTHDIIYLSHLDKATCSDQSGPRPLVFDHATSSVVIALKAADSEVADYLKIFDAKLDDLVLSGKLALAVGEPDAENENKRAISATWDETALPKTSDYHLGRFKAADADHPVTVPQPDAEPDTISQSTFVIPGHAGTSLTLDYTLADKPHKLEFPFAETWQRGKRYTYLFTCNAERIEISADAYEGEWNTEIGGTAFEPTWSVEMSTGAYEATWAEEIGGEAYEVTWRVEMSVTALEAVWMTEAGASASEGNWSSETGASANENNWSSETGGNAYEEDWTPDGEVPIGGETNDPAPGGGE